MQHSTPPGLHSALPEQEVQRWNQEVSSGTGSPVEGGERPEQLAEVDAMQL